MNYPKTVERLIAEIGLPAALQLVEAYGGTRLFLPTWWTPEHPTCHALAETVGEPAARGLVDGWGDPVLHVPRCAAALRARRDREIADKHRQGRSAAELAREYHCDERTVYRACARIGNAPETRQTSLPF